MDANDEEKFNKIIKNIQINLNHKIIQNFNKTIQDIQHNESVFKQKILHLRELINSKIHFEEVVFAKDLCIQMIAMYKMHY